MRSSKAHWGYSDVQLADWEQELTIDEAHLQACRVFSAQLAGALVGFYSLAFAERRIYMENLFVAPACMSKGYGKALFDHAVEQARDAGGLELWLRADPHAAAFYNRMGMRQVGLTPGSGPGRFLPLMLAPLV